MEEDVHEPNALVSELLSLARLDQQHGMHVAIFPLAPVLRECEAKLGHAPAGKQAVFDISEDIGDVTGDSRLLARAVSNLLLNAAKYSVHRVALHASRPVPEQILVAVEDDGPGIPPDEHERLFEPFHRLDRSRYLATGGFGLGLAIARKAVRLHGGDIKAGDSVLGGACFVLTLPAAPESAQKKSLPV